MDKTYAAHATGIQPSNWNQSAYISENIFVSDKDVIDVSHIDVNRSVYIENHGYIRGDIHVASGRHLYLRNTGTFAVNLHLDPGARVTQITNIRCGANCTLWIRGKNGINLSDILSIATGAEEIIIEDSEINMNIGYQFAENIRVVGSNTLRLPDNRSGTMIISSNMSGSGTLFAYSDDGDIIYTTGFFVDENGNRVLKNIADYSRTTGFNNNKLIDAMTLYDPDNALLKKLHAATSKAAAREIMSRSVRANPIRLMDEIKMLDRFVVSDSLDFGNLYGGAFTVFGPDAQMGGLRADGAIGLGPVHLGISGYAARQLYDDGDINEFDASIYGANVHLGITTKHLWTELSGGMSMAAFEIGPVLNDSEIVTDPDGKTFYGRGDVGVRLMMGDMGAIIPFVGGGVHHAQILDANDTISYGRAGLRVEMIQTNNGGVEYTGHFRAAYNTDQVAEASLSASIVSPYDGFGVSLGVGAYYSDHQLSYKVSLGGHLFF